VAAEVQVAPEDSLGQDFELLNIDNLFLNVPSLDPPAIIDNNDNDDVPPTVPSIPNSGAATPIVSPHPQSPLAHLVSFLDDVVQPPATSQPRPGFFNEEELATLGFDPINDPPTRVGSGCSETSSVGTVVMDHGSVADITVTPTSISGSPAYSGTASTANLETISQKAASGGWIMSTMIPPPTPMPQLESEAFEVPPARSIVTTSIPDLSILLFARAQRDQLAEPQPAPSLSLYTEAQRRVDDAALFRMRAQIGLSGRTVSVLAL
jgi:hypothetical protein